MIFFAARIMEIGIFEIFGDFSVVFWVGSCFGTNLFSF